MGGGREWVVDVNGRWTGMGGGREWREVREGGICGGGGGQVEYKISLLLQASTKNNIFNEQITGSIYSHTSEIEDMKKC